MYPNRASILWYALPILLGIIGGVIAYFVLRRRDPRTAQNCLIIGLIMLVIGILVNLFSPLGFEEVEQGFKIGI